MNKSISEVKERDEIVITISGGLITSVMSTNPNVCVYIADYDISSPSDEDIEDISEAEERLSRNDMHVVY